MINIDLDPIYWAPRHGLNGNLIFSDCHNMQVLIFCCLALWLSIIFLFVTMFCAWETGERGGSVVECRTPEREVRGSKPTAAVLCPWARHFTPRKYWLITQEAMAPSRYDWKIVDWDVKPQHNQPKHGRQRGEKASVNLFSGLFQNE